MFFRYIVVADHIHTPDVNEAVRKVEVSDVSGNGTDEKPDHLPWWCMLLSSTMADNPSPAVFSPVLESTPTENPGNIATKNPACHAGPVSSAIIFICHAAAAQGEHVHVAKNIAVSGEADVGIAIAATGVIAACSGNICDTCDE